jgi:hypothetical protein
MRIAKLKHGNLAFDLDRLAFVIGRSERVVSKGSRPEKRDSR